MDRWTENSFENKAARRSRFRHRFPELLGLNQSQHQQRGKKGAPELTPNPASWGRQAAEPEPEGTD